MKSNLNPSLEFALFLLLWHFEVKWKRLFAKQVFKWKWMRRVPSEQSGLCSCTGTTFLGSLLLLSSRKLLLETIICLLVGVTRRNWRISLRFSLTLFWRIFHFPNFYSLWHSAQTSLVDVWRPRLSIAWPREWFAKIQFLRLGILIWGKPAPDVKTRQGERSGSSTGNTLILSLCSGMWARRGWQ